MGEFIKGIKSFVIAMRAGSAWRRAKRLKTKGSLEEAYKIACGGLLLLRQDVVNRDGGPESTEIVFLTMLVEQLSRELGKVGADEIDIRDSFHFLDQVSLLKSVSVQNMREKWLPYFEQRIKDFPVSLGNKNTDK